MADALDLILEHLERLLSYPDWLPIEKYEILFYCDELKVRRDLCPWNMEKGWRERMKAGCKFGHNLGLVTGCKFNICRDLVAQKVDSIGILVANVFEQKNETNTRQDFHFYGPPNLIIDLGAMVRGALSVLYGMNLILHDDRSKFEPDFYSGLYFDEEIFQAYNSNGKGEICVGFDVEIRVLLERLTTILKQLEVISIVGMGGLGKTTLARKVYDDPLIVYHFYIRAWVNVSQVYNLRDILLGILSSVIELTDEVCRMSAYKLGEELYRRLKGNRYMIVVDDIWNIGAWDDIKRYFPNDNNGSRIMLTTRQRDVALHAQSHKNPHVFAFSDGR